MARNRRSLLVPEAKSALDQLKQAIIKEKTGAREPVPGGADGKNQASVQDVANQLGIPFQQGRDNGEIRARDAGKIGGQIGGSMVKRLVSIAQQQLSAKQQGHGPQHRHHP